MEYPIDDYYSRMHRTVCEQYELLLIIINSSWRKEASDIKTIIVIFITADVIVFFLKYMLRKIIQIDRVIGGECAERLS